MSSPHMADSWLSCSSFDPSKLTTPPLPLAPPLPLPPPPPLPPSPPPPPSPPDSSTSEEDAPAQDTAGGERAHKRKHKGNTEKAPKRKHARKVERKHDRKHGSKHGSKHKDHKEHKRKHGHKHGRKERVGRDETNPAQADSTQEKHKLLERDRLLVGSDPRALRQGGFGFDASAAAFGFGERRQRFASSHMLVPTRALRPLLCPCCCFRAGTQPVHSHVRQTSAAIGTISPSTASLRAACPSTGGCCLLEMLSVPRHATSSRCSQPA